MRAITWACCVLAIALPAHAWADQPEPIVVVGLRPATGTLDGPTDIRRLGEAQKLRRIVAAAVREIANRPIIDDPGLRSAIGVEYLVDFTDCRGKPACVQRLVARRLKRVARIAVYGDYVFAERQYRFRVRRLDFVQGKVLGEVEIKLADGDVNDRKLWRRDMEALFATATEATTPAEPPPKPDDPPTPNPTPDPTPPPSPPEATDVPELAPISSGDPSEAVTAAASAAPFIDNSMLDSISRGITWHGHFTNYSAMGVRGTFGKDVVAFDDRLQLEFESDLNHVRVVGKPQLLFNVLDNRFDLQFREMYAARDYKRFDIAVGEQIVTWGNTDFWPVVDILNPREFTEIKNWKPIDNKLSVAMVQSTLLFGPVGVHLIAVPVMARSRYQLDPTKPFAIPVPAPPGVGIAQLESSPTIANVGGGARIDVAVGSWKLSGYGLVGRDPIPAFVVVTDPNTMATTVFVDNDRVAMAALGAVGGIAGAILKTEAAAYRRLDDECEGRDGEQNGLPECFYLRRAPTGRATLGLERRLVRGLDAHLQLIAEYTRPADIPRLPPAIAAIAPGLPEQFALNRIATLRLSGNWVRGDFRPSVFAYWSYDDESMFVNGDLEYHLSDGFALAVGGFLFHGYAKDPDKDKFTLAGSLSGSSNVYLRATAWF